MNSKMKLKRFCFLGSFEPVYVHLRGTVQVEKYWPIVEQLIQDVSDTEFLPLMREVLCEVALVRRDEALFLYAAYLASSISIQWKTAMRYAFPVLVRSDDDLFLFCKYASLIGKIQNHKGFSRTVRKAITAWYEMHTIEDLRTMWMAHRGLHGFSHKVLIKLCRISDKVIGSPEVAKSFFKTCTELIKQAEDQLPPTETSPKEDEPSPIDMQASDSNANEANLTIDPNANEANADESTTKLQVRKSIEKLDSPKSATTSLILAVSKLRTTKKPSEALKIIRKYKLSYSQVPSYLLNSPMIIEALLPTMSYLQILKCWRTMTRFNLSDNSNFLKDLRKMLDNRDLANKSRVHPVHLLMCLDNIVVNDLSKLPIKHLEALKADYLYKLYKESFHWHANSSNLRMHITVNLQSSYKKKFLKNHKKLSYYDACLALSFGYSKREAKVDVFHWYEDKMKLKKINFEKNYTTQLGFSAYDVVENKKNNQRLVAPIINALGSAQIYDVFLCIVPTAGRGNPKQNSDFLCMFLDKYRQNKNPNAKFIILNLLKFRRSMSYSETRSENILEICGLDDNTTDIIHNFVTNRFD